VAHAQVCVCVRACVRACVRERERENFFPFVGSWVLHKYVLLVPMVARVFILGGG
jgi:hypothetical protein